MSNSALHNRTHWENEELKLDELVHQAVWPGGEKAVQRLAKQGKQPVRALIGKLIDPDTEFYEFSRIAGFGMDYPDVMDVPCGGLVTGLGKIHGNWTMIFANDSRVKAGTYFPITLKKHMRAQAMAERCGLNCVYIADSGGAYLPMQAEVFPDDQQFGSMFYNMARMSAKGLKQITMSTGGNTAGGAYMVFMACQSVMIDKMSYSFLGGPPLVKAATGEVISAEDLGGARVHTQRSGGADHLCQTQDEAIAQVREILSLEPPQKLYSHRYEEVPPRVPVEAIYEMLPANVHQGINVRAFLEALPMTAGLPNTKGPMLPESETTSSPASCVSRGCRWGSSPPTASALFLRKRRKRPRNGSSAAARRRPRCCSSRRRRATWWARSPSTWASVNTEPIWCGRCPAPRCHGCN